MYILPSFQASMVDERYKVSFYSLAFFFFFLFRAASAGYGCSQDRGRIRAAAAGLHHSHSNLASKLHLRPTPLLMANTGSLTHRVRPGIKPASSWILVGFVSAVLQWEVPLGFFFFFKDCLHSLRTYPSLIRPLGEHSV